jgi:hypothetical protein
MNEIYDARNSGSGSRELVQRGMPPPRSRCDGVNFSSSRLPSGWFRRRPSQRGLDDQSASKLVGIKGGCLTIVRGHRFTVSR